MELFEALPERERRQRAGGTVGTEEEGSGCGQG